jgi:uncharacterized membrane protein
VSGPATECAKPRVSAARRDPASCIAARSELIAIAYPDEATAREVRDTLLERQRGHSIYLEDVVVVTRDGDSKFRLHQPTSRPRPGRPVARCGGTLIGMLFSAPLLGTVIGAASGAAAGALSDIGIQNDFLRERREKVAPGKAATIVLVRKVTPDKVVPEIAKYGGEVLRTSLNEEGERRLQEALCSGAGLAGDGT